MTVVVSGLMAGVVPAVAQAACSPYVTDQGYVTSYSHNGARIFSRTVSVYNPCADTTWMMDIRPAVPDKAISPPTGRLSYYPISSSWTIPYVEGFYAR